MTPEASTSTPHFPLCSVCGYRSSIYTCPRCAARTCSLPCSTSHKSTTGCTGERNKAAYVPMNQYGWGTMMNDYVFLEEVGRRVGDWGKEIVRGGYGMSGTRNVRSNNVRGRGSRGRFGGNTKRDMLKLQLEARDIDMELLPAGMERRKINQSFWETKTQTAFLTIEFKFHPPRDPLVPASQHQDISFILISHKNNVNTPLLSLIQRAAERALTKKDTVPEWVKHFVIPHPDDPESFYPPQCVMVAQLDPRAVVSPNVRKRAAYYRFDPTRSLAVLLRHTHFVEFPSIELWEEFNGTVVDTTGIVTQQPEEEERPLKRRKIVTRAGKRAMTGLLGEYGSDDEGQKQNGNSLSLLGDYAASDDEDSGQKREASLDGADTDEGEAVEMDPAVLLELMRQAQGRERWEDLVDIERDDEVDWGDSEEG